jgi:RNA polymerase sigma-70 factor (ECF subfamily)
MAQNVDQPRYTLRTTSPEDARAEIVLAPAPLAGHEPEAARAARMDFSEIISAHYEAMYRYAFRLSGCSHDAEDLTQQAFLVAREKIGELREPDASRAWLFTVLRNLYLRQLRRRSPLLAGSLPFALEEIPARIEDAPIDSQQLQTALDRLPAEHRLALMMFYFEKLSYREIAQALGIAVGTVMSRLARAKERLRREFEREEIRSPSDALLDRATVWLIDRHKQTACDGQPACDGLEEARARRTPRQA